MINDFKNIGKIALKKSGYFDNAVNEIGKRKILLDFLSIKPYSQNKEETDRALVLNFDLKKKEFSFKLGKELSEENRKFLFAFSLSDAGSNTAKQFLATNKIDTLTGKVYFDSQKNLSKYRKSTKIKPWFNENVFKEYDDLLKDIINRFFTDKDSALNPNFLTENQKKRFKEIEESLTNKDKKPPNEKVYRCLINNYLYGKSIDQKGLDNDKDFPSICYVTFNDQHILEHENNKYREAYINLIYFVFFYKEFIEDKQTRTMCHVCNEVKEEVTGTVKIPLKFYGTTNKLNFSNIDNKNSFKSFSICSECLASTIAGIKYIQKNMYDYLFETQVYMIPKGYNGKINLQEDYKRISRIIKRESGSKQKDLDKLSKIIKSSEKKNLFFDFMFFHSENAQFDILKLISNVDYYGLLGRLLALENIGLENELDVIGYHLNWTSIYFMLFPSKYCYDIPEDRKGKDNFYKTFRRELLDLFEKFVNKKSISYFELINRFTNIYSKRFYHKPKNSDKKTVDEISPLKMVLLLSFFNKYKQLRGTEKMEGQAITIIQNEAYNKFFETHSAIYENNYYRQGLFLLGTIINGIVSEQQKKHKAKNNEDSDKSKNKKLTATFFNKLNYNGIPARQLKQLILDVREYSMIYNVFEENGIWGNITDRLQGIESSTLTSEEVVFYILTGISFAKYISIIKTKK